MNNKIPDLREMQTQEKKNNYLNFDLIKKNFANTKALNTSKTKGMSQFKPFLRVV